eukprot:6211102-Pleurochrysis_carterae.AAC.1
MCVIECAATPCAAPRYSARRASEFGASNATWDSGHLVNLPVSHLPPRIFVAILYSDHDSNIYTPHTISSSRNLAVTDIGGTSCEHICDACTIVDSINQNENEAAGSGKGQDRLRREQQEQNKPVQGPNAYDALKTN